MERERTETMELFSTHTTGWTGHRGQGVGSPQEQWPFLIVVPSCGRTWFCTEPEPLSPVCSTRPQGSGADSWIIQEQSIGKLRPVDQIWYVIVRLPQNQTIWIWFLIPIHGRRLERYFFNHTWLEFWPTSLSTALSKHCTGAFSSSVSLVFGLGVVSGKLL